MAMRFAMIAGLAAVTVYGAINLGADKASLMLVDAGRSGLGAEVPVWVLAILAGAAVYAVCRDGAVSVPPAVEAWASGHKTWLFAGSAFLIMAAYALA